MSKLNTLKGSNFTLEELVRTSAAFLSEMPQPIYFIQTQEQPPWFLTIKVPHDFNHKEHGIIYAPNSVIVTPAVKANIEQQFSKMNTLHTFLGKPNVFGSPSFGRLTIHAEKLEACRGIAAELTALLSRSLKLSLLNKS